MNKRALAIALILSGIISVFLWKKLDRDRQEALQRQANTGTSVVIPQVPIVVEEKKESVLVAKKIIPARLRLDEKTLTEFIQTESRNASSIPPDAFRAADLASLSGRFVAVPVLASDCITARHILVGGTSVPALSYAVAQGKRAVTIPVDPTIAVGGFIQQGDYVDVIAIFPSTAERSDAVAKIVLQDIKVLAVGGTYEFDASLASTPPALAAGKAERVTLEVSPEELERVIYISNKVNFRLVLKNPEDVGRDKRVQTQGANEKVVMSPQLPGNALPMPVAPTAVAAEAGSGSGEVTPAPLPGVAPLPTGPVGGSVLQPKVEIYIGRQRQEMDMDVGAGAAKKSEPAPSSTVPSGGTAVPAPEAGE